MPEVTKQSNLYRTRGIDVPTPDPVVAAGVLRVATGTVTNADDDSSGSTFLLAALPSGCLIDPSSFFAVDDWGFAEVRIGTADTVGALVSAAKADGDVVSPIAAGDANFDKRLWEVLGLASDPGGSIAIYAHAIDDAAAAGSLRFRLATLRDQ